MKAYGSPYVFWFFIGAFPFLKGSEGQVQIQLQKPWAADGVLDNSQLSRRRDGRRGSEIRVEADVVVGRVEIRMVEEIEGIRAEAQVEALGEAELLAERGIEADSERPAEQVAST